MSNALKSTEKEGSLKTLFSYGLLGFPLAYLSLPLYVFLPDLLERNVGLSLGAVGVLILALRLIDTFQDPLLGILSDRLVSRHGKHFGRLRQIYLTSLGLLICFPLLYYGANYQGYFSVLEVSLLLFFCYSFYSFVMINYLSIASEARTSQTLQNRLSTSREFFTLLGVTTAVILPFVLETLFKKEVSLLIYLIIFAATLIVANKILWMARSVEYDVETQSLTQTLKELYEPFKNDRFRKIVLLFFINTSTVAVTGALFQFFVRDALGMEPKAGLFLAIYFGAGILTLPLWLKGMNRFGPLEVWITGSAIAILVFIWAYFLSPGDGTQFAIICLLSGACIGVDLAVPPALVSNYLEKKESAAKYYGLWALSYKLSLAVGAFTALTSLQLFGYEPGSGPSPALSFSYAVIPCILKAVVIVILIKNRERFDVK